MSGPPVALPRATPRRAFAVLAHAVLVHPVGAVLAAAALVADAAVSLLPPLAIGLIVDVVARDRPGGAAVVALLVLVAGAVGGGGTAFAAGALTARVTEPAVALLRERALAAALEADAGALERAGTGDATSRLTEDVERLADAASGTLAVVVASVLSILGTLGGLAVLDWRFAVGGLLAVPVQVLTLRWYLGRATPVHRAARDAQGVRAQRLLDAVRGIVGVRALRLGAEQLDGIRDAADRELALEADAVALGTRFSGRLNVAEFAGLGGILVAGFLAVSSDTATIGAVTAAALLFNRVFGPVNTVLGLADVLQEAAAGLTRVVGLVDLPATSGTPDRTPVEAAADRDAGGSRTARTPGAVRVRGLRVTYPNGREALRGVDLDLAPGERVAVVGASGSGKSTLARALVGGVPLVAGTVSVPAGPVVLLEQRTHVFAGTLAADLGLVAPDARPARLETAATTAGLPLGSGVFAAGLASAVGSTVGRSTAADAQHIALARLDLAEPAVAVLDEASADAGSAAAAELERAIDRVLDGRTALVVAHRLSQALTADRVVLLADGRVVADGPHASLLERSPEYRRLWESWTGSATDP